VRFVEKPNLETAEEYVRSGDYLWNPGVFVWKNSTLIDAFREHQPAIYDTLTSVPLDRIEQAYPSAPRATIAPGTRARISSTRSEFGSTAMTRAPIRANISVYSPRLAPISNTSWPRWTNGDMKFRIRRRWACTLGRKTLL